MTDSAVKVYTQPNKVFKLSRRYHKPVIMVGPGTGIAPFRAFLEERAVTHSEGQNWLFFGDQHAACDFLYQDELTQMQKDGILNRLDTAFSRDQAEKIYVQDKMREQGAEIYAWLEQGGYFYVCGDASRWPKMSTPHLDIIKEYSASDEAGAEAYHTSLKKDKRYLRDVYCK